MALRKAASPLRPASPAAAGQAVPSPSNGINLALAALSVTVTGVQFAGLPLAAPALGPWAWLLLLLSLPLAAFQWAVLHEALHGHLLGRARANAVAGRVLGVLHGVPFHLLRFGHLAHHRFNRCAADRPEVYDPRHERQLWAALRYYAHLLGGMYLGGVAAGLAAWLPRPMLERLIRVRLGPPDPALTELVQRAHEQLAGRYLWPLRADAAAAALLGAAAVAVYGERLGMLVCLVAGRGLVLSLGDNAYHYGTPLSAPKYAKTLGLPRGLRTCLLHLNLHRAHHAHPHVPWRALPAWDPPLAMPDAPYVAGVLAQLKGPLPVERVGG